MIVFTLRATVFLVIARVIWKTREMVVREQLFAWPLGIAFLFTLFIGFPSAFVGGLVVLFQVLATSAAACIAGVAAAKLWILCSYDSSKG